jgi:subtilase family serine protease
VKEKIETNNTRYITVRISRPDLYIYALTAPLTAQSGQTITIQDTTKNNGMSGAVASTTKFYLSKNGTLDGSATPLGSRPVPPLPKGAGSGPVPTAVTIPTGLTSGTYYIIAKADADGAVTESLETNNTKYRTIKIMP